MNEQINSVIINFLDNESKFHYLNYYYSKMLDETTMNNILINYLVYTNGGNKKPNHS